MGGFGKEIRRILRGASHQLGAFRIVGGAGIGSRQLLECAECRVINAASPAMQDQIAKSRAMPEGIVRHAASILLPTLAAPIFPRRVPLFYR
jgi:hypothetical protein